MKSKKSSSSNIYLTLSLLLLGSLALQPIIAINPIVATLPVHFGAANHIGHDLIGRSMLLIGISSYIFGILIQRFGWHQAVFGGLGLATIGNVIALLGLYQHQLFEFSWGQQTMAIGCGVCLPAMYSYVVQQLNPNQQRRFFGLMSLGLICLPALLQVSSAWLSTYYTLYHAVAITGVLSAILWLITQRLPKIPQPSSQWSTCLSQLWQSTCCRKLMTCSLIIGLLFGSMWLFSSTMSFMIVHTLHQSPYAFSIFALLPNAAFLAGTVLEGHLSKHLSHSVLISKAALLFLAFGGYQWLHLHDLLNLHQYHFGGSLFYFFVALMIPSISQIALQSARHKAIASGILSSLYTLLSALIVMSASQFSLPPLQLLSHYSVAACAALLMLILTLAILLQRPKTSDKWAGASS